MFLEQIESRLKKILVEQCGISQESLQGLSVTISANIKQGHFTIPLFKFAKESALSPQAIAQQVAEELNNNSGGFLSEAIAVNAFVNMYIPLADLIQYAFELSQSEIFSFESTPHPQRIMVEFLSPNTNKPLHLGHLRNLFLGESVCSILEKAGHDVARVNLVNDRGIHICKSMLAYQKHGKNNTPESTSIKGDHFVGGFYVKYNEMENKNPDVIEEVEELLLKWEAGDDETLTLWKKMDEWVMQGFEETWTRFGISYDKIYRESETYMLGKDLVEHGLEMGVFEKAEGGEIICRLPEERFKLDADSNEKCVTVLRADGTSVYMTQDIGTAYLKQEDFNLDQSVYVVANEQDFHFEVLFYILEQLGFEWARGCYHLSYGMVNLPEGRMKSREGTVVDADVLIDELLSLAYKRDAGVSIKEAKRRAEIIAQSALKFYLLLQDPKKSMMFNPEESLSFQGKTGPYCQYAVVRCHSLLNKGQELNIFPAEIDELDDVVLTNVEQELLLLILKFQHVIKESADTFNPAKLVRYTYELAQSFNHFYHQKAYDGSSIKIVDSDDVESSQLRLLLVCIVKDILTDCLFMLGIQTLEKM